MELHVDSAACCAGWEACKGNRRAPEPAEDEESEDNEPSIEDMPLPGEEDPEGSNEPDEEILVQDEADLAGSRCTGLVSTMWLDVQTGSLQRESGRLSLQRMMTVTLMI